MTVIQDEPPMEYPLYEEYPAHYRDAHGEEGTVIRNDGRSLRMVLRGVEIGKEQSLPLTLSYGGQTYNKYEMALGLLRSVSFFSESQEARAFPRPSRP